MHLRPFQEAGYPETNKMSPLKRTSAIAIEDIPGRPALPSQKHLRRGTEVHPRRA